MAIRIPKPFEGRSQPPRRKRPSKFEEGITGGNARLLHEDGTYNVDRVGGFSGNTYKTLVHMSWRKFFFVLLILYIIINSSFALLYLIEGTEGVNGLNPSTPFNEFLHAFYFSVQTFTTLGYGHMNPESQWANLVSTLNAFTGLLSFAIATGLSFAKFSMPTHEIIFSDNMLISGDDDEKVLTVRFANSLDHKVVDLSARITMTWVIWDKDHYRRKFDTLQLELDHIYMFPLNWTLVHVIDESSPLLNKLKTDLAEYNTEFLVELKGYDITYGKAIHTAKSYNIDDLVYGAHFVRMYETGDKETTLHLDLINKYEKS